MTPRVASFRRLLASVGAMIGLFLLASCQQGEKREYLGPPDPTPVDNSIAALVVVPHIGTLQLGEQLDLAAFGRTAKGDSVGVNVSWSASGGAVESAGRFQASHTGSYWVVARSVTQAEKADSANVLVVGQGNPITKVQLSPKTLSIRVGQSRQFTAAATYQDGTPAPAPIFWSASAGTIDQSGFYTPPPNAGEYLVIAVVGSGLTDTATVSVGDTPVLASLSIDPPTDSVPQGDSRQFTVSATWSDGSSSQPVVDFSTTGGVIDSTGGFTAAASPGDYVVQVRERGGSKTNSARIWIVDRPIASVGVLPSTASLAPGSSLRFSAQGFLSSGTTQSISVTWKATGGSISSNGEYTAGATPGSYRVIATATKGGTADTAAVTIAAPAATLSQLVLNPSTVTVAAGDRYQFSVSASWSDGGSTLPPLDWSATGGTITSQGQFTAGSSQGTFRVIAKQHGGTVADTSVVTVAAAKLMSLDLTPAAATVESGKSQTFAVSAQRTDGSTNPGPLSWSAAGGSISGSGVFTAGGTAGTYRVIVKDQGQTIADTGFVTVTTPAPVLQSLVVNPPSVTLQAGEFQDFFARGVLSTGATTSPAVDWSATGGSISEGGRFTAGSGTGTFRIIGRDPASGLADTSAVSILPRAAQLTGIQLTPDHVTIQVGSNQQYQVAGLWTSGGSGSPAVNYSATGGTINASGLYTAGSTAGTFRVIAVQQGGTLADTVTVSLTAAAPVLTGLDVTPALATVGTGGSKQFSVAGVWTNGGSGAPAVAWSATGGSVSSSGVYTAGQTPGTFRVVATQQGGTLADTAKVLVASATPTMSGLTIKPGDVVLQTGTKIEFQAEGSWTDGSSGLEPVTWSVTGGGSLDKTSSTYTHFTAGNTSGTWKVVAKHQSAMADTVNVTIGSPFVTKVNLTPASVNLNAGATQQFSASAVWSDGVSRPVAVSYTAKGGTISVNGLYKAGTALGTYTVIATCSCGKADTSLVGITASNSTATLQAVQISPTSVTLSPNGTKQFSVTAQWSDGSTTLPSVTYSATGGSISSSGLYTAPASSGSYTVTVNGGGKSSSALGVGAVKLAAAPAERVERCLDPRRLQQLRQSSRTVAVPELDVERGE